MDARFSLGGALTVSEDVVSANRRSVGVGGRSHAHAILASPVIVVTTPVGRGGYGDHVIRTAAVGIVIDFDLSGNSRRDDG